MIKNTLRFYNPETAKLFETFCLSHPPKGQVKTYDEQDRAYVYDNHFENATAKSKFIAAWASVSMEHK